MDLRVNLLPWREHEREYRKRLFLFFLGLCGAASLLVALLVHWFYARCIDHQGRLNDRLTQEISLLNVTLDKIKTLEKEKNSLVARMTIIQDLQTRRAIVVRLVDQLVHLIPKGIALKHMEGKQGRIELLGEADSNTDVSTLMRDVEKSEWLIAPSLEEVKTTEISGKKIREFKLAFFIRDLMTPEQMFEAQGMKSNFTIKIKKKKTAP